MQASWIPNNNSQEIDLHPTKLVSHLKDERNVVDPHYRISISQKNKPPSRASYIFYHASVSRVRWTLIVPSKALG